MKKNGKKYTIGPKGGRVIDLTGQKYNRWTVLKLLPYDLPHTYWLCQCDCGTLREVEGYNLKMGKTKSCGCLRDELIQERAKLYNLAHPKKPRIVRNYLTIGGEKYADITGMVFGRLTALNLSEVSVHKDRVKWKCKCTCGKTKDIAISNLRSGHTQSCGCLQKEKTGKRARVHGLSKSKEHGIWSNMKRRCSDSTNKMFQNYGGRGITVCDEWQNSFKAFYRDMGPRPSSKHSIDRIDNDGNYEPGNCRWATQSEQGNNTRVNVNLTHEGETKTQVEWGRKLNISHKTIHARFKRGWSVEETLTTPLIRGRRKKL